MRDLLVTLVVFGAIPSILMRPWLGILMWNWLGYMNPHRLTWGFAYSFPFAQVTALATLAGIVLSSDPKRMRWSAVVWIWLAFLAWMNLTTLFALPTSDAGRVWEETMKIQLFALITVMLITTRGRLIALAVVTALSLAFFGVKGGAFAAVSGSQFLVWGPPGSFIEDNNALALALIMTLPLLHFLQSIAPRRWMRWALTVVMGLTALSILTSHSRGALLAVTAMAVFMWLKSNRKMIGLGVLVLAVPVMLAMMPAEWYERMSTLRTYQEDNSAMGRITAWRFAAELAYKRPIGAGFGAFTEQNYRRYAPGVTEEILERDGRFQGSHSIYFRVLGEHGYLGLALFLALGLAALSSAGWVIRQARGDPELAWAGKLAAMLQVSLIGYAVGGAFLHLSYFDLYYNLLAMVVVTRALVEENLAARGLNKGRAGARLSGRVRSASTPASPVPR